MQGQNKIYWLDNLRTFMVFLVVVTHVATTYEKYSMGKDWWLVVDPLDSDFAGILFLIMNIFVMATIFFVSGFFAPLSLQTKSIRKFVVAKFKRLMIPWLVAVFTLIPAYKIIFLYSRGLPQEHWTSYLHWNTLWSQNWLWFLPVLFCFNIIYIVFSKINTTNIRLTHYILITAMLGYVFSFCMDYFGLHGWTKSVILDFQNERILIYFLVFLVGAQTYQLKTFESKEQQKKTETIIHSLGWIPINVYIGGVIYNLINPNNYLISKVMDISIVRISFVLSVMYLIYALVMSFKNYLNKRNRLWSMLNKNSYSVYIIHVIVLGAIAYSMVDINMPAVIKVITLTITTYLACNLLVVFYDRLKKGVNL